MATFPSNANAGGAESLTVCLDPGCTIPAPIVNPVNGAPIPGSILIATPDGLWPQYACAAPILYALDNTGRIITINPIIGGPAITVTGSRSTGAAVTSLIAALVAQGLNIVDGTVA